MDIQLLVDHALTQATLVFTSTLNQAGSDESWGVRDIQIITKKVITIDVDQTIKENNQLIYSAFTGNEFTTADSWTIIEPQTDGKFTACNEVKLFGGFRVLGNGSSAVLYLDLPPHFMVRVKFTLYKIDSWDNELFLGYADGDQKHSKAYGLADNKNLCGAGWNDEVDQIDLTFAHNNPNIQILLTSTLNQVAADESWGIRDFYLFVEKCPNGCLFCS